MRNKSKLSKSLLSVKSPTRYLELSDKLESIEKQLKDSYEERRRNQENEAIRKMKRDPKFFSNMPRNSPSLVLM